MVTGTGQKSVEMALRFAFGGAVTVTTQLIARAFGPVVAGLFLAFPAILPATLTLIRKHDGPREAAEDALGALTGSAALVAFGACVWKGFEERHAPWAVLLAATALWFLAACFLWWVLIPSRHKR
jgi:uncharacterized membrane protein (GlpM family)